MRSGPGGDAERPGGATESMVGRPDSARRTL